MAKVIFLHLFVILFRGGVSAQCMLGYHTPPEQTPPQSSHPPGADTPPRADTPQDQIPLGANTLPQSRHPPPREADSGIRSMSGRYASYWNAFFLLLFSSWSLKEDTVNLAIHCVIISILSNISLSVSQALRIHRVGDCVPGGQWLDFENFTDVRC